MRSVSAQDIRALLFDRLGLGGAYWPQKTALSKLRDLGMVQIDSIRVTGLRNHELAFVARSDAPADRFYDFLYREKQFLETHYPVFAVRRDWVPCLLTGFADRTQRHQQDRRTYQKAVQHVLDHIRQHGPTSPADLQSDRVPGGFNTIKATTRAMDMLFAEGVLQIAGRSPQFHRLFDLTERHFPELAAWQKPEASTYERFLIESALSVLKIATAAQVAERAAIHFGQWRGTSIRYFRELAARLLPEIATPVQARDLPDQPIYWYLPQDEAGWKNITKKGKGSAARIVPPLDNLLFNRRRLKELFDFDYKFEAYTPAKQRRFYFAMPIIYDADIVGVIDAARRDGAWHVLGLDLRSPVPGDGLRAAVHRLAGYSGATRVKVSPRVDRDYKRALAGIVTPGAT